MSIIVQGSKGFVQMPASAEFNGGSALADASLGQSVHLASDDPVLVDSASSSAKAADGPAAARGVSVTLDTDRLVRAGHIVPPHAGSPQAEEFRHMKRQLLKNARSQGAAEHRLSLIMVTSALPREGKTFCAINLALSIAAEIDTSVLLVDADVVQPAMMNRLGIKAGRGLLDVLTEPGLDVDDVILQTNVPKLAILPPGTRNVMSSELLSSAAMESLLVSLAWRDPNRVVIFDAPPLLMTNEAKVLASRVGQVLLVVAASSTPRSAVMQAFATVEQCPIVMSVLNKTSQSVAPYGYGQYRG